MLDIIKQGYNVEPYDLNKCPLRLIMDEHKVSLDHAHKILRDHTIELARMENAQTSLDRRLSSVEKHHDSVSTSLHDMTGRLRVVETEQQAILTAMQEVANISRDNHSALLQHFKDDLRNFSAVQKRLLQVAALISVAVMIGFSLHAVLTGKAPGEVLRSLFFFGGF